MHQAGVWQGKCCIDSPYKQGPMWSGKLSSRNWSRQHQLLQLQYCTWCISKQTIPAARNVDGSPTLPTSCRASALAMALLTTSL